MSPLVLPPQSHLGWKVSVIIFQAIAVLTTVLRLICRFRSRKAWWDDYILFIPLVFNLAYWIVFCWGYAQATALKNPNDDDSSQDSVFDSYWLATLPGILVWWGTRAVLCLTLARIFPVNHPARRWPFILTAVNTVLSLTAVVVTIATCDVASALLNQGEFEECVKGPGGFSVRNIFLFAESLGTDILLAALAATLLWRVKFSAIDLGQIVAVLSASLIILLYTLIYLIIVDTDAVSMGDDVILIETGLHNIQTGLALFLCNLPVIVTCAFSCLAHSGSIRGLSSPVGSPESTRHSHFSPSCSSDPPTHLTLTDISDLSGVTELQSDVLERSFGSVYSSWHASQKTASLDDGSNEKSDASDSTSQPDLEASLR